VSTLVTGATDGIGKATAEALAGQGEHVIVHGRAREKVDRVVSELRAAYPNAPPAAGAVADFADLAQVRTMGENLVVQYPSLRVVVHNAGLFARQRQLSADGYELTFAVNHLAPFALTRLLLPILRVADDARVVLVSSGAHQGGALDFDDLHAARAYDGFRAYATSKLCNVLFANALARRHPGLSVNSLHPGVIATKLLHAGFGPGGAPLADGARTTIRVATDPALRGVSGRYFANERETRSSAASRDEALQERLWTESDALVDRVWAGG
jgi:retinol dehydrogenase 14